MPHTLRKQLTEMKLTGMAAALSSQMEQPGTYEELSFRERPALLVTHESLERDQRKQKRLLQKARLRLEASVHDIDYQPARNLERSR
ncbi:IstB-like ATP-binding domain-containing protein, partial [Salmonella enterica subsp. enterica serovar Irumu]|nr:IstB-like ATP-binding domain-containing protein [Salmonella enterica subsp. enterica serovar Irumu]